MNEKLSGGKIVIKLPVLIAVMLFVFVILASIFPIRLISPFINFIGLNLIIFTKGRIPKKILSVVWPLFGILLLGLVNAPGHLLNDIFRDISYALNPIFLIFVGYWLGKQLGLSPLIFKTLVLYGLIAAVLHLFKFVMEPELLRLDLETIRETAGAGDSLVTLSFIIVLFQFRFGNRSYLPRFIPYLLAIILLGLSFVLSFSRTNILVAIILSLSFFGSLSKISFKTLFAGTALLISTIFLIVTTPSGEKGTLRAKLISSATEVSVSEHENENINANWRGFEAFKAVEGFMSANLVQKTIGQGFGALVDLGFYIKLGDEELRYIPILHNGYAYILTKIGLLGIMLYALFFYRVIRFGTSNSFSINPHNKFYARLLVGCIWTLIFVMIIGGGMAQAASPGPVFVILIGYLVHCIERFQSQMCPVEMAAATTYH